MQISYNLEIIRQNTTSYITNIYNFIKCALFRFCVSYVKIVLKNSAVTQFLDYFKMGLAEKIFLFLKQINVAGTVSVCGDLNLDLSTDAYRTKSSRADTISRIDFKLKLSTVLHRHARNVIFLRSRDGNIFINLKLCCYAWTLWSLLNRNDDSIALNIFCRYDWFKFEFIVWKLIEIF